MSDEIFQIIEEMELFDKIDMLESRVDLLRSEVDTIGNVLLQLIHARNDHMERGEE